MHQIHGYYSIHLKAHRPILTISGAEKASAEIVTSFAEDTIAYVEANSVISFDIKLNEALTSDVALAMTCSGECGASIDLANVVDKTIENKWQSVSIDLG